MSTTDPILEEFLANTRGDSIFESQHALFVPPDVQIELRPLPEGAGKAPYIVYPVSEDEGLPGWQFKTDTAGLLNDFLQLAEEKDTNAIPVRVAYFARDWGPLWTCQNLDHTRSVFGACYYRPRLYESSRYEDPCSWDPYECPYDFVAAAQRVKAVLAAANRLRAHQPVPEDIWSALKPLGIPASPFMPRSHKRLVALSGHTDNPSRKLYLSTLVTQYLTDLHCPRLWLHWAGDDDAKLTLVSGWGFLRTIWVEVAQLLGHVKAFSLCDACGVPYFPVRKAKESQKTFCKLCRDGQRKNNAEESRKPRHLGSKKLSARRRRDLERKARQLYAEGTPIEDISQHLKPGAGRIKIDPATVQKWVSRGV